MTTSTPISDWIHLGSTHPSVQSFSATFTFPLPLVDVFHSKSGGLATLNELGGGVNKQSFTFFLLGWLPAGASVAFLFDTLHMMIIYDHLSPFFFCDVCIVRRYSFYCPMRGQFGFDIRCEFTAIHHSIQIMVSRLPPLMNNSSAAFKWDFNDNYNCVLSQVLGRGCFGVVRICTQRRTGRSFAVKSVRKRGNDCYLENEINVLSVTDHVNIMKMVDYYEDLHHVHIVTEKYCGGDLFDKLESLSAGCFTESMASNVVKSLLSAVTYLHDNGIVHRDIKLENVLYEDNRIGATVKLIDFGLSCFHRNDDKPLTSFVGTRHYASPELIIGKYEKLVDVWSVGVVLYILLSGCMPFTGGNNRELYNSILNDDLDFSSSSIWRYGDITSNAKDLIQQMLVKDPVCRTSPSKALLHPWFLV